MVRTVPFRDMKTAPKGWDDNYCQAHPIELIVEAAALDQLNAALEKSAP